MAEPAARLGREDWVGAALEALAEGGVEAVRVEVLARRLKVTKGSFYWHFQDRPALLAALREHWEAVATGAVIRKVEEGGGDAPTRLWRLMELTLPADGRVDMAMRAWAAVDAAAADAVQRVDRTRIAYLEGLFAGMGLDAATVRARSRLAYFSLIGEFAVGVRAPVADRLAAGRLNHAMLVRP